MNYNFISSYIGLSVLRNGNILKFLGEDEINQSNDPLPWYPEIQKSIEISWCQTG